MGFLTGVTLSQRGPGSGAITILSVSRQTGDAMHADRRTTRPGRLPPETASADCMPHPMPSLPLGGPRRPVRGYWVAWTQSDSNCDQAILGAAAILSLPASAPPARHACLSREIPHSNPPLPRDCKGLLQKRVDHLDIGSRTSTPSIGSAGPSCLIFLPFSKFRSTNNDSTIAHGRPILGDGPFGKETAPAWVVVWAFRATTPFQRSQYGRAIKPKNPSPSAVAGEGNAELPGNPSRVLVARPLPAASHSRGRPIRYARFPPRIGMSALMGDMIIPMHNPVE